MSRFLPNLPLAILVCLLLQSIYVVSTSNITFSYEHYVGLVLVIIAIVSAPFGPYISKAATFLALLLGMFSQAAFTAVITQTRIGFSIGGRGMEVVLQLFCILLLGAFLALNWNFVKMVWGKVSRK